MGRLWCVLCNIKWLTHKKEYEFAKKKQHIGSHTDLFFLASIYRDAMWIHLDKLRQQYKHRLISFTMTPDIAPISTCIRLNEKKNTQRNWNWIGYNDIENRFNDTLFSARTQFHNVYVTQYMCGCVEISTHPIKVAHFTNWFNLHDFMVCTTLFKLDGLPFNFDLGVIFFFSNHTQMSLCESAIEKKTL